MTHHDPTRKKARQRERKAQHTRETAARDAYNRDGLDAACRALGAGEATDWPQDNDMPTGDSA